MNITHKRIQREIRTVKLMIIKYCKEFHAPEHPPCLHCQALLAYALKRLSHCPYQEHKTTCSKCPTHCYNPSKQKYIREVMRYSGPRLMLSHPILTLLHVLDGFRRPTKK
ncbi:nitrous oxide-stimulated promoter family protein [Desulfogranum japonicum]|uniref:nitrous oxide-stimulated promoter family protein n=1 Tax=Desulfogranum japonicum TaxID=231447 RepID=UPI0022B71922|nr:nitrous oxide-stimulated promoter family protein [Desulfogranum japonicum]